jgi:hypothetical protein
MTSKKMSRKKSTPSKKCKLKKIIEQISMFAKMQVPSKITACVFGRVEQHIPARLPRQTAGCACPAKSRRLWARGAAHSRTFAQTDGWVRVPSKITASLGAWSSTFPHVCPDRRLGARAQQNHGTASLGAWSSTFPHVCPDRRLDARDKRNHGVFWLFVFANYGYHRFYLIVNGNHERRSTHPQIQLYFSQVSLTPLSTHLEVASSPIGI